MAEPARAGASDFFHSPTIPRAVSPSGQSSGGGGGRAARRPGAPGLWGLHRVHPPDRIGDPECGDSPSLPSSGGVNASGTQD
eukprot:6199524-Pleurochrysis_carterae.AAC.1